MSTSFNNSENPYVLDEFLFANQPHFNYPGSKFALAHRIVSTVVPSIGILAALLVAYLAAFQTPTHIKSFSRMILLCSISDILYSLCDLWVMSRFTVKSVGLLFSFTGPVSMFSYKVQCHSMSVKAAANVLGYLVLPLQYNFRYQTLKKGSPPSLFRTSFIVLFCLTLTVLNGWIAEEAYCTFKNPNKVDFGQFWYKEAVIPQLIVGVQEYRPAVLQLTFFSAVTFLSYAVSIFYARKTVTELTRQATYMSARTLAMQKQIGRALLAQSISPLVTSFIPVMLAQMSVQLGMELGYFQDANFCLMAFFPLLNSLSTLWFIVPYRQYCLKHFVPCFYKAKRPALSTSVALGANPNSHSGQLNQVEPINTSII